MNGSESVRKGVIHSKKKSQLVSESGDKRNKAKGYNRDVI